MKAFAAEPRATRSLSGIRILFVEDDEDVREATEALLAAEAAVTTSFAAAEPAIELLHGPARFDLLLTDIVLGGPLSGLDVMEAAKRLHPSLPVIVTSGYVDGSRGISRSIPRDVTFLLKPFRRDGLLAAIDGTLPRIHSKAA